jgi:proline iminopeptidase
MFPAVEPSTTGMLPVSHGNEIYWEISGNPQGRPALYVHGGPGGYMRDGYRRIFDPDRYRIIGFDQRGCGRSRPLATADLTTLHTNTTSHLIADIEALRVHLGVDRWLLYGASWGTCLALSYAQTFPDRISEILLAAVALPTPGYVEWITDTVGRIFPEQWERFERASQRRPAERIVDAYARILRSPYPAVRAQAALDWCTWEDAHVSLDPNRGPGTSYPDPTLREVFATLVTHYWSNGSFLPDGGPLASIERIAHIPGAITHGAYDVSGPAADAWHLHRSWPASRFELIGSEGHGGPLMMQFMSDAASRFADRSAISG